MLQKIINKGIFNLTMKEFIRNKISYVFLGLSLILISLTYILDLFSLGEGGKVFIDISLFLINFISIIFVLYFGQNIYEEKENKTFLFLLSKPISLSKYIFSKILSLSIFFLILYIFYSIFITIILYFKWGFNEILLMNIYITIFLMFLKIMLFLSLSFLFSLILTSKILNILFLILIYFFSSNIEYFYIYGTMESIIDKKNLLYTFLYYLLPNFSVFNTFDVIHYKDLLNEYNIFKTVLYFSTYFIFINYIIHNISLKKEI